MGVSEFKILENLPDNLKSSLPTIEEIENEITAFYNEFNKKVEIYRFGIKDFSIPEKEYMIEILNRIDDCLNENKKVYIHCMGGIGRTGTVVGCYLVCKGITSNSEALTYLKDLRKHLTNESPETNIQKEMIKTWQINL